MWYGPQWPPFFEPLRFLWNPLKLATSHFSPNPFGTNHPPKTEEDVGEQSSLPPFFLGWTQLIAPNMGGEPSRLGSTSYHKDSTVQNLDNINDPRNFLTQNPLTPAFVVGEVTMFSPCCGTLFWPPFFENYLHTPVPQAGPMTHVVERWPPEKGLTTTFFHIFVWGAQSAENTWLRNTRWHPPLVALTEKGNFFFYPPHLRMHTSKDSASVCKVQNTHMCAPIL